MICLVKMMMSFCRNEASDDAALMSGAERSVLSQPATRRRSRRALSNATLAQPAAWGVMESTVHVNSSSLTLIFGSLAVGVVPCVPNRQGRLSPNNQGAIPHNFPLSPLFPLPLVLHSIPLLPRSGPLETS